MDGNATLAQLVEYPDVAVGKVTGKRKSGQNYLEHATLAQLVEQLICNQ